MAAWWRALVRGMGWATRDYTDEQRRQFRALASATAAVLLPAMVLAAVAPWGQPESFLYVLVGFAVVMVAFIVGFVWLRERRSGQDRGR